MQYQADTESKGMLDEPWENSLLWLLKKIELEYKNHSIRQRNLNNTSRCSRKILILIFSIVDSNREANSFLPR